MLVDNNVYSHLYVGNGTTKNFAFVFPILESGHIQVRLKNPLVPAVTLTIDDDYTLAGVGDPEGGEVQLKNPPVPNAELLLQLNVPLSQVTKYIELDIFPSLSHENALSKLTLICQELAEKLSHTVSIPEWGAPDIPGFPNDPGHPMTPDEFIRWFINAWLETLTARDAAQAAVLEARAEADRACDCADESCMCADVSCGCAGNILTPFIISPTQNEVGVSTEPYISLSEFAYEGRRDTAVRTQVQITTRADAGYQTPVWAYDNGYTTLVKVDSIRVIAPTITAPANNSVNIALQPAIQLTAFAVTGGTDSPEMTQIQITRSADVNFNSPIWTYSGQYTVTAVPDVALEHDSPYIVRAAHKGHTLGWSLFSETVAFTTKVLAPEVDAPTIIHPQADDDDIQPNLYVELSVFSVTDGTDTPSLTQVQVARPGDVNFQNLDFEYNGSYTHLIISDTAVLDNSTQYIMRARHAGVDLGWSQWSVIITFTTEELQVRFAPPPILSPGTNVTTASLAPTFSLGAWSCIPNTFTDYPIGTRMELTLATDTEFATPVWVYDDIFDTTVETFGVELAPTTEYLFRARYRGLKYGWGFWTEPRQFRTTNRWIMKPTIIEINGAPPSPTTVYTAILQIKLSPIAFSSGTGTLDGITAVGTRVSDPYWLDKSTNTYTDAGLDDDEIQVVLATTDTPEATSAVACKVVACYRADLMPESVWSDPLTLLVEPWGIEAFTVSIDNPKVANRKIKVLFSNNFTVKGSLAILPQYMNIQIATDPSFAIGTTWFDNTSGTPIISATVTNYTFEAALPAATTFWMRARRFGRIDEDVPMVQVRSAWSNVVNFTTA